MSIRQGLLALLVNGPNYGYQLRADFEECTGSTWPLNIGQAYTTLSRLERDGLIEEHGSDDEDRQLWAITDAGRVELHSWFFTPLTSGDRPRDELSIKLALAAVTPDIDVELVVQTQRIETLRHLQQYTKLKQSSNEGDLAWMLVLDGLVFHAEAEIRWLDHCEGMVTKHRAKPTKKRMSKSEKKETTK